MREKTWNLLEGDLQGNRLGRAVSLGIIVLILANVVAILLESVSSIYRGREFYFYWFELFSVGIFTVEYVARVASSSADPRYGPGIRGKLRYMATPMAIIDLLAILPAFLFFLALDLRILRVLRIFRLLRLLKLARYSQSLSLLGFVVRKRRDELLVTVAIVFAIVLIASTMMYYVERDVQPDVFSSIPATMWWAVVTLTTVGYGDTYPMTGLGRMLAALMALAGVGFVAVPAGLLTSAFVEELERRKEAAAQAGKTCPHCGKEIP